VSDYGRLLRAAGRHVARVARIADRLLAEKRIGQGTHDALVGAAGHLLEDAYMAGLCEPQGVGDVRAEMRRFGDGCEGGAVDPCPGCGALPGESCEPDCPDLADPRLIRREA
jgi:hypothetical protein